MKQGFSLIECTIYLAAFTCITTLALQSVMTLIQKVRINSQKTHQALQIYTALDVMTYELQKAPFKGSQWYEHGAQSCIWYSQKQQKCIGLTWFDKKIVKISGAYSIDQKKLISKVSNILAENVEHLIITYDREFKENKEFIKAINIGLKTHNSTFEKSVCLKNGFMYE